MVDDNKRRREGRVTVVIPSRNEGGWVKGTVQDVLQAGRPLLHEVVVVDDGSDDGSCDGLPELGGQVAVRVYKTEGIGQGLAKNLGASKASGDVVVFLDAHSRPQTGWLEEICDVLDMGHAGAAPVIVPFGQDGKLKEGHEVMGRWYLSGRSPFEVGAWPGGKGEAIPLGHGACQAFHLDAFQTIGGFCPELSPWGEDTEICLRMWSREGTIGAAPGARIATLEKEWDSRPDKDEIIMPLWINLVKAQFLHWNARRLTAMWAAIAEAWRDHPDLYDMVWEACHDANVLELRRQYRSEAALSDDDVFALFPELDPGE